MKELLLFLNDNSGAIGVLIAFATGFWALIKLREYLKDKRFKTYHEQIDELVNETRNPDRIIKLDRQIAIVFELRNFTNYYPVPRRILIGLKEQWKNQPNTTRAIEEIDLTLDFISKNWLVRTYRRWGNR